MHDPLAGQPAHVLQASGEPVALALELGQGLQTGTAEALFARHPHGRGGDVRKAGGENPRELALQPRDLRA